VEAALDPEAAIPAPLERWNRVGYSVLDPEGRVSATCRTHEEARRFAAAMNAVAGIPTDALEGFTTGVIHDPVQDIAAELGAMIEFDPYPNERRQGERRIGGDRRRAVTLVSAGIDR